MTASIENIVQHLFHQPSLQAVSVDELQQMTQDHPSFAAARFLLLKKMQETGHPDFTSQLHKTTVYFNNPLWLQLLLSPMQEASGAWRPPNGVPTEMIEHDFDLSTEISAQAGEPVEAPIPAETPAPVDESLVIKQIDEPLIQEVLARLRGQINDAGGISIDKNIQAEEPLVQEVLNRLREQINEAGHLPPIDKTARIEDPLVQEVLDRLRAQIHQADAQHLPEPPAPAPPVEEPQAHPTPKVIIETPMAQHDVLFEPYHTIDYFASQGIRLDKLEPMPKDRLGRQLKSFTEWLKSMKKLPQASIEEVLAENEESAVVAAASHSVEGKDVITEAMAEVFEKQGLYDKAAEVYRKLSLLNPAKSAYFADRINALKHP